MRITFIFTNIPSLRLCINPKCQQPENKDNHLFCLSCGSELLLQGLYHNAVKLKNCSPQVEENSESNSSMLWVLKTSLTPQNFKTINPNSDQVSISKNCQVSDDLEPSPSVSPSASTSTTSAEP